MGVVEAVPGGSGVFGGRASRLGDLDGCRRSAELDESAIRGVAHFDVSRVHAVMVATPSLVRSTSARPVEVGPPHGVLADYHSLDSRVRRLEAVTNGSIRSPTSAAAPNQSSTRSARSVFQRLGLPSPSSISK